MVKSSVISGFYKLPIKERLAIIKSFADLTDEEVKLLENTGALPADLADHMVISSFEIPGDRPFSSQPESVFRLLCPW